MDVQKIVDSIRVADESLNNLKAEKSEIEKKIAEASEMRLKKQSELDSILMQLRDLNIIPGGKPKTRKSGKPGKPGTVKSRIQEYIQQNSGVFTPKMIQDKLNIDKGIISVTLPYFVENRDIEKLSHGVYQKSVGDRLKKCSSYVTTLPAGAVLTPADLKKNCGVDQTYARHFLGRSEIVKRDQPGVFVKI